MKYIATLIVTLFVSFALVGQATNLEEVVYLKNGSIIRGTIIEQVPNQSIKIQTKDGSIFAYSMNEVEKITKETPKAELSAQPVSKKNFDNSKVKEKGYTNITEFGGIFKVNDQSALPHLFTLTTINGYQINRNGAIGFGTGIEIGKYEKTSRVKTNLVLNIPFFIDGRYYILKKRVTPLLAFGAGYNHSINLSGFAAKGGAMAYHQIGIRFYAAEKVSLIFSLGYRFQHSYYRFDDPFADQFQGHDQSLNNFNNYSFGYVRHTFSHLFTMKAGFTF